jgi:hypothetical protein
MGRTINYAFKKEGGKKFTDSEIETFIQVRNKYATGKFAGVWSCESFYPEPINYFPNWNGVKAYDIKLIQRQELNNGDGYDYMTYIEKKVEELMKGMEVKVGYKDIYSPKKKLSRVEAYKLIAKNGWITIDNEDLKEIRGFVKVQGNEFNAALTFMAIKELTMLMPNIEARMSDEGEFLLCPIRLKQGKAIPLLNEMKDDMQHYALKMLFSKEFTGNILDTLEYKEFCHEFTMDLNIDNGYGDMTKYINEKLRNIKEVERRIYPLTPKDSFGGKCNLYLYNLEQLKIKEWYEADLFTRIAQVNPKDFLTYKMTPATIMDSGETYYGLSDVDAEMESYKAIAQMQKVLEKLGMNNTLQVLGEGK